jgi:hypothetical protein
MFRAQIFRSQGKNEQNRQRANDAAFFSHAIGRNDVRTHRANTMEARQALM